MSYLETFIPERSWNISAAERWLDGDILPKLALQVRVVCMSGRARLYACVCVCVCHSDSDAAYTGPAFEQLDDTLQQAFLDYLEERGITAELGR